MKQIARTESFREFSQFDYIYIDKTEQIFNLLSERRVFVSRPRRFGKSLMLDTIGTLFEEGVEPSFKGTWIYEKWTDKKYPVLRLNFLGFSCSDFKDFCVDFDDCLAEFARLNGLEYASKDLPKRSAKSLFSSLRLKGVSVVILIAE